MKVHPTTKSSLQKDSLLQHLSSAQRGGLLLRGVIETVTSSVILGLILWAISWSFGLVGGIR